MCLDYVNKEPVVAEGEGWKVVRSKNKGLYPPIYGGRYRTGRWVKDRARHLLYAEQSAKEYPAGFHIFARRLDAFGWKTRSEQVRRVSFRQVVATGRQDRVDVIVAREIYIHPEGK